jgi:hypothetical protein
MDIKDEPHAAPAQWLLLVHQLPAKPAYLRVKIWRRLQALGAVTVKNSVYVLPAGERTQEDFEWLLKEVETGGGEGMICEARLVDGLSDQEVRALFNTARETDYDALAGSARELEEMLTGDMKAAVRTDTKAKLAKLKAEAARIGDIDFFGAHGRETVDGLLGALAMKLKEGDPVNTNQGSGPAETSGVGAPNERVWVTRQGLHVDRLASAWLIRRFIDPQARFKFVPAKGYVPQKDELRFDMFEAEFTHEGDRCTFEVLLVRSGLTDPALMTISEIVHDIDLKDNKFGREETGGIARLVEGISMLSKDDGERLQRGIAMFDDLYGSFRRNHSRII